MSFLVDAAITVLLLAAFAMIAVAVNPFRFQVVFDFFGVMPVWKFNELKMTHANQVASMRKQHEENLLKASEAVESIVNRLAQVRWDRSEAGRLGTYQFTIAFDGELLAMVNHHPDDIRYIAEDMGRRLEYEILRHKFVEPAPQGHGWRPLYSLKDLRR